MHIYEWALCGHCVGTAWALCGHCVGTVWVSGCEDMCRRRALGGLNRRNARSYYVENHKNTVSDAIVFSGSSDTSLCRRDCPTPQCVGMPTGQLYSRKWCAPLVRVVSKMSLCESCICSCIIVMQLLWLSRVDENSPRRPSNGADNEAMARFFVCCS